MNYILSSKNYNYDIVTYEQDASPDYKLFNMGKSLRTSINEVCYYSLNSPEALRKLQKFQWLSSTGPDLVSPEFRNVIERVASTDVEFFETIILNGKEKITGYSAINILKKTNCLNLDRSEYKPTNFDASNPTYRFYYMVVDEEPLGASIVRSIESSTTIVVSEAFKDACIEAKLKGLLFCDSIDITPQQRSKCIDIKS